MRADFPVILDACVLANQRVCDLFLTLAETPRLYLPCWSREILVETQRTHIQALKWPDQLSESWQEQVGKWFPDSCIENLHRAVCPDEINAKDRHVVQAAMTRGAEVIVTFNLRDFPSSILDPLGIKAISPADFALSLLALEPLIVSRRINEIAEKLDEDLPQYLKKLRKQIPAFVEYYAQRVGIELE